MYSTVEGNGERLVLGGTDSWQGTICAVEAIQPDADTYPELDQEEVWHRRLSGFARCGELCSRTLPVTCALPERPLVPRAPCTIGRMLRGRSTEKDVGVKL